MSKEKKNVGDYPRMGGREITNVAATGLALWRRDPTTTETSKDDACVRLRDVLQEASWTYGKAATWSR